MRKEFSGKKLLILGGITLSCDIVKIAKQMGAYVAVLDYYENSPAKSLADEGVLIDATDVDAIVDYCLANNIDGVTTGFVDILMPVCYEVCRRLNLPYYATKKMIQMATNKKEFKTICQKHHLLVPKTFFVGSYLNEKTLGIIHYPVFVKPLDASGSRGAGVCNNREELIDRFAEAVEYSDTNQAIIEEYIVGREFLLNYFGQNGEFRLLSMFDRYMCDDRGSAVNYSNMSVAPSKAINYYLSHVNDKVINMFRQMNFDGGLIFLQGHYNGENIIFYEMGCRLGGSYYYLEEDCVGLNAVEMIVRYALTGEMVRNISTVPYDIAVFKKTAVSVNYLLKGDDETIHKICGLDVMKNLNSYVSSISHKNVGDHYSKDKTIDKPVVNVFLTNSNRENLTNDIVTLNESFKVINKDGKSLLMEKLDPNGIVI